MEENNLAAILMTEGTSLTYFSGMHWWGGERLFAMVLPAKGQSFYVCPAFEEGRAHEQIAKAERSNLVSVLFFDFFSLSCPFVISLQQGR